MKDSVRQHSSNAHLYLLITALLALSIGADRLRAGTDTWTGGGAPDGNWQNANNWGGIAPLANDTLVFTGFIQTSTTNNFAPGTPFSNIQFDPSADLFTLNGNSITIPTPAFVSYGLQASANYLDGSISNIAFSVENINLPLTLANGHHNLFGNVGGGTMNLAGTMTLGSASSVSFSDGINVTGAGLSTLNGILGGWATMSPPTTWATLDGSGNVVGYTAFTDIVGGGTITGDPTANLRITTSGPNITNTAAGTTDINSLFFADGGANQIVEIPAGRILRFGSKGGIFNASRQLGTSRVLTIGTAANVGSVTAGGADNTPGDLYLIETPLIGNTGNQLVMSSRITNNGTAAVTVHIFGHVNTPAGIAHTYSGGTYIHGGRLSATGAGSLGSGPVIVYPGGQLFLNAAGTYTNAVSIAGLGNGESVGNGAIRMGGRSISGTVTLMQDAATANGTLSGRITGPGSLMVGAGNANGVGTLIIGSAAGANDYSGDTLINSSNATGTSTLQIAATRNNIMPHGTGKGNLIFNGVTVVATFDLNGTSQIINGMGFTGAVARAIVTSSTAGSAILTVGDNDVNGNFSGTIQNGAGNVGLTKIGAGTQTLTGVCTYTNATTVSGGKLFFGVGSFPPSTAALNVNSNATLDLSLVTPLTLAATAAVSMSNGTVAVALPTSGAGITTPTLVALGSTNFINVASIPAISTYPAIFTAIKYTTTLVGTLNFGLGTLPISPGTPFAGFVSNNVINGSVDVVVTGGPTSLKWQGYAGGAPNSTWDIANTVNWVTFAGGASTYSDGSFVQFDNTASNGVVTLAQDVGPAGVTITNTALAYTINGGGKIGGGGGLTKLGSGTAILANTGLNDFSGAVNIGAGTLQLGNSDASGTLPATVSLVDNSALVLNRSDIVTVSNIISGTGSVAQNGSGTVNLSGVNTFNGAVTVASGATLQLGSSSALGTTNGATTVASGGTLDIAVNAINVGQEPITISGSGVGGGGALINSSGSLTFVAANLARLTMANNATVGGSGRMDLRSATTSNPLLGSLSTGGQPFKLTKVGTGTFGFIGITVDPALGDIEVQQGIFSTEAAMTTLGNKDSNVMVWPGGTFQMFAITNQINKVFTLGGDGVNNTVSATSGGGNTIIGPMAITNDCIFNVNNNTVVLNLNNVLTGPGKITKVGAGLLVFSGNSPSYTGGLLVNNGNVTVNGTLNAPLGVSVAFGKFTLNGTLLGGSLTNVNTTTIAGSGTNAGFVDVGGNLFPGDTNSVGTFSAGGGMTLEPGATLTFDLGATNTPGGTTNDLVVVNGDLTVYGNAITINPLGLLSIGAGNPYVIFTYSGNLNWTNDLIVTGPNNYVFTVDTNTPGQIKLVATGGPPVWNGASVSTSNWSDSANWHGVGIVPGDSLFFEGPSRLNNVNDTAAGTTYIDLNFVSTAGSFVLTGNSIALGGNVINNSPNSQTLNLGLEFSGSRTVSGTAGPLIIGGGLTNTANLTTLTLGGNGTLTNLMGALDPNTMTNILSVSSNANWAFVDNANGNPITAPVQLDIVGGTLTYGSSGSAPVLNSVANANNSRIGNVPGAPAALNMVNGTLTIAARLNTGTAANSLAAINQTGGTLNIQALLQVSDGSSLAYSTVTVTGGSLNVGDAGGPNNFFLASRGTGIVTVATSGVITCATLDVSRNASTTGSGSVGVVNLNSGGTMVVNRVGAATSATQNVGTPTATFNFNGGTLRAGASSTTFIQGNASAPNVPVVCIVKSGGAIIDTTNFNDTILEPMQHDASLGGTPDGGLLKKGSGTLTLAAGSSYTGPTIVTNGTLALNASVAATAVAVATNGTLAGTGTAGNSVTINAGGTLSPANANAIGTLSVAGNVTLQPGSTNFMELNHNTATSDQVRASAATATTITYGGTLSVTNLAGTLTGTDTFKLFNATNYAGAFSALNPAIPQPGLAWNTNTLTTDGTLRFTVTVNTTPTNLTFVASGNQLTLSWPVDHIGWRLQVQTNSVTTGLANNWVTVPGSDAVNSMNFTISPANGAVFYRMIYP